MGCAERCGADRNRGHREDGGGRPGQEGWLVAVHDGSWSPPALFAAVESALDGRPDLERVQDALSDAEVEDRRKLALVGVLLEELWETLDPEERELALAHVIGDDRLGNLAHDQGAATTREGPPGRTPRRQRADVAETAEVPPLQPGPRRAEEQAQRRDARRPATRPSWPSRSRDVSRRVILKPEHFPAFVEMCERHDMDALNATFPAARNASTAARRVGASLTTCATTGRRGHRARPRSTAAAIAAPTEGWWSYPGRTLMGVQTENLVTNVQAQHA